MKSSKIAAAVVSAMAGAYAPAYAMTVGEAKVLSYTDQPLRVLIPLKAQGWEWKALFASVQTYQKGLGLSAILYKPSGSRQDGFIEIRSTEPVTEPIVDLQITFETGHRTTIHRVPILIDIQQTPVVTAKPQSVSSGANRNDTQVISNGAMSASNDDGLASPKTPITDINAIVPELPSSIKSSTYQAPPAFAPASLKASNPNGIPIPPSLKMPTSDDSGAITNTAGDYKVQRGDTLHNIAKKFKPALWSIESAMAHIHKKNPQAFKGAEYKTLQADATLVFAWSSENATANNDAAPPVNNEIPQPPAIKKIKTKKQKTSKPQSITPEKVASSDSLSQATYEEQSALLKARMSKLQEELKALQAASPR